MSPFLTPRAGAGTRRYLITEMAVMAAINTLLTLALSWLMLGQRPRMPVWGADGLVVDLVPTAALATAFMVLTAGPVFALRRRGRKLPPVPEADLAPLVHRMPRSLLLRALVLCPLAVAVMLPPAAGLLALAGFSSLSLPAVLAVKAAFALCLGAAVCPFIALPAARRP